jgi:hypothetical protein
VFQRQAGGTRFGKTCGDDDGSLDPVLAAILDDIGHGLRRRGDDRELHCLADLKQRGVGFMALNFLMPGIDRKKRAFVTAFQHVVQHNLADRINAFAGSKYGDRFGREQRL